MAFDLLWPSEYQQQHLEHKLCDNCKCLDDRVVVYFKRLKTDKLRDSLIFLPRHILEITEAQCVSELLRRVAVEDQACMHACFLLLPARQSSSRTVYIYIGCLGTSSAPHRHSIFPFPPPSSLVCKWLTASVAFASWGSSHTASTFPVSWGGRFLGQAGLL